MHWRPRAGDASHFSLVYATLHCMAPSDFLNLDYNFWKTLKL